MALLIQETRDILLRMLTRELVACTARGRFRFGFAILSLHVMLVATMALSLA